MRSSTQHNFARIPAPTVPRSLIQRNSSLKTAFDSGLLIPIFNDEILPGDTVTMQAHYFGRLPAALVTATMDNMHLDFFWFFVPNRLVWDNWVRFMGEKDNPGDTTTYEVPQITAPPVGGWEVGTLADYLGMPIGIDSLTTSALYHRAYNLVYNEFFRAEFLIDSAYCPRDDGPDNNFDYPLQRRGKRHDYFTACNPWPQAGPDVELPIATEAPVIPDGSATTWWRGTGSTATMQLQAGLGLGHAPQLSLGTALVANTGMKADLNAATAININGMREAITLQQMYEVDARGGLRYTSQLQSHFGVSSPDQRLQRPEILATSSQTVNIHTVAQTSSTDATTPQGNVSAFATLNGGTRPWTKSFVEHGMLIGLCCLRADLNYQQGLHKRFQRKNREEFYFPTLANLGEQAVLNSEIFATGVPAVDDAAFGYQSRWDEYRYGENRITGKMRSTAPGTLDVYHLAQNFTGLPALNQFFIEENPPVDRILSIQDEPEMIFDAVFNYRCARPMPVNSRPGLRRL